MSKYIVAFSDIHGYYTPFLKLFNKVRDEYRKDELQYVFLGDYIDRGPDSAKVVDFMIAGQTLFPEKYICLLGNHEEMMLNAYVKSKYRYFESGWDAWWYQGGRETDWSYTTGRTKEESTALRTKHMDWMMDLPLSYETDDFVFVHAGLAPDQPINASTNMDKLWIREEYLDSDWDWGKRVISGHTFHPEPVVKKNLMCIDTGYGRPCAVVLKEGDKEWYQIIQ